MSISDILPTDVQGTYIWCQNGRWADILYGRPADLAVRPRDIFRISVRLLGGSRTGCLKFPVILPRDGKCGHNGRRGSPDRGSVASGSAGHCRTVEAISSGPVGEIMESLNACMASRNNMYVLHTGWKCVNITRRNRDCELDLRIVRSVIRVLSQPCMQFLSCNCYTFPVGMRCSVFTGCVVKADLHLPHPPPPLRPRLCLHVEGGAAWRPRPRASALRLASSQPSQR